MRSVIIFREKNFLFALDKSQFEQYFLLEQIWIQPSEQSEKLWKYQNKEKKRSGQFVHFGHMLGLHPAVFSHEGSVFLRTLEEGEKTGIYINNFVAQIPYEKASSSFFELGPTVNIPDNTPWKFFKTVFKYKRRRVLMINPDEIIKNALGIEEPEEVPQEDAGTIVKESNES